MFKNRFRVIRGLVGTGLAAVTGAIFLATAGLGVPQLTAGQQSSPSEAEQRKLKQEKAEAMRAAGVEQPTAAVPPVSGPQPTENYTMKVHLSKAELLERIAESEIAAEAKLAALELELGRPVADDARAKFRAQQTALRSAIPDEGRDISIEMAHVGEHSINFSSTSYNTGGGASDPVGVVFYNQGSHYDVEFDLRNWTSISWEDADGGVCGDPQQSVWLNESDHGGVNSWYYHDDTWQPDYDTCSFDERDHMRFWAAKTFDSYHGYGSWSVATPHREHNPVTTCDMWGNCYTDYFTHRVTSRHAGRDKVEASFRSGGSVQGAPLWFVGQIYKQTTGSAGNYGGNGVYWDGQAVFIRLDY